MIADTRALRDLIAAVHRHNAVGGKAVTGDERAGVRRRGAHDNRIVRRAVDALAVRCGEMDVDGIDRELARNIFEIVVGRLERAARYVRRVLARMECALRKTRRILRVRNRGIENRPRRPGVRDRLIVCEVLERDAVVARIVFCIAVVGLRFRLAANRDRARHDAVVDLDFVVEFVVPLVGDLLIGDRRVRAVGVRTRAHPDVGHRVLHRAVRRYDVGVDVRQLRRAEVVRSRVLHMGADVVDLILVERTARRVAVVLDVESCGRCVEERVVVVAVGAHRVELERRLVLVVHRVLPRRRLRLAWVIVVHAVFAELEDETVDLVVHRVFRMDDVLVAGRRLDGIRARLVLEGSAPRLDHDVGRARADDLSARSDGHIAAARVLDADGRRLARDLARDRRALRRLDVDAVLRRNVADLLDLVPAREVHVVRRDVEDGDALHDARRSHVALRLDLKAVRERIGNIDIADADVACIVAADADLLELRCAVLAQ